MYQVTIPISILRALVYARRAYQVAKPVMTALRTVDTANEIIKLTNRDLQKLLYSETHDNEDAGVMLSLYGAAVLRQLEQRHQELRTEHPSWALPEIPSASVADFIERIPIIAVSIRGSRTLSGYYHKWISLYAEEFEKDFGTLFFHALDKFNGPKGEEIREDNFYQLWSAQLGAISTDSGLLTDIRTIIFKEFSDQVETEEAADTLASTKLKFFLDLLKRLAKTNNGLFFEAVKEKDAPSRSSYLVALIKDKIKHVDTRRFASFVNAHKQGDIVVPPPLTAIVRKRVYTDMRKGMVIVPPLELMIIQEPSKIKFK